MASDIGPTDGNLHALREREAEQEEYEARFVTCPECDGAGEIAVPLGFHTGNPETDDWDDETCPLCKGTGQIDYMEDEY